jgi:hypothetical protein
MCVTASRKVTHSGNLWTLSPSGVTVCSSAQIDALLAWIDELGENFDEELGRIVPFDYSASLTAAMDLHSIGDPQTAWAVFSERAEALAGLRDRLQDARMGLLERR